MRRDIKKSEWSSAIMIGDLKNDMFIITSEDLNDDELIFKFEDKYGEEPIDPRVLLISSNPKHTKMLYAIGDAMVEDEWMVIEIYNMINNYSGNPAYEIPYIYNELCDGMINEAAGASINSLSVDELCDKFRSYKIHRVSSHNPEYKGLFDNLVRRLPIRNEMSIVHTEVEFTFHKASYTREPAEIILRYWQRRKEEPVRVNINDLGPEGKKMCLYTLQEILDKIEYEYDAYRKHPEMRKVVKEIGDILRSGGSKFGNYTVEVEQIEKEYYSNRYKFIIREDNRHRYPMGWFIVEEDDDNGALHVNWGWPLSGNNIGGFRTWEETKELAYKFLKETLR